MGLRGYLILLELPTFALHCVVINSLSHLQVTLSHSEKKREKERKREREREMKEREREREMNKIKRTEITKGIA